MSLVGSLEDLGLGDILQIVSLSRKSGLLLLRSDGGEGRIVLCDGLVRAAFVKGQPEDLRGVLVGGGFVTGSEFDECARAASESGRPVAELIRGRTGLTAERLDSLRREHVERAVLCMFTWRTGEFSFEVRDEVAERDRELLLPTGINAQYLAMEATRLGDETGAAPFDDEGQEGASGIEERGDAAPDEDRDDEPMFSGEDAATGAGLADYETPSDELAALVQPEQPEPALAALAGSASQEIPAAEDLAVAEALPAAETLPVADELPAAEEFPSTDEFPAAEEFPSTEEFPVAEELPAAEEIAAEEPVAAEELPCAEEIPAGEQIPAVEEAAAEEPSARVTREAHEALALATARQVDVAEEEADAAPGAADASPAPAMPVGAVGRPIALVAIDPDLAALEWIKASAAALFGRIHIFQDRERGLARIRQYLGRAQRPTVLLAAQPPRDGVGGGEDVESLVRRLKNLAPAMPVLALYPSTAAPPPESSGVDACVARPPTWELAERKRWSRLESAAEQLRAGLAPWAARSEAPAASARSPSRSGTARPDLARLKQVSAQLRDRSARGDVLARVLDYASEFFSRVAIFVVRDDTVQGIAQIGLERAGGPDDERLREIQLPAHDTEGFRQVIDEGEARRFDPGGGRLSEMLGDRAPSEAYVAPIESGDHVAALLYADNLPDQTPIGDTTALEIVLHEAGLALDRALLERALADASERTHPPNEG